MLPPLLCLNVPCQDLFLTYSTDPISNHLPAVVLHTSVPKLTFGLKFLYAAQMLRAAFAVGGPSACSM